MTWRTVLVRESARVTLKRNQLSISNDDREATIPVEDISVLILEDQKSTLSSAIISKLLDNGATIVHCDAQRLPCGLSMPFHGHSRTAEIAQIQIDLTAAFKKQCWRHIIRAKVVNQSHLLDRRGARGPAVALTAMSARVRSGDTGNVEAQAAREYWKSLAPDAFNRKGRYDGASDILNHGLNYGYAILRSLVARAITAAGLLPALGLHHNSKLNAFNLADDLIEPYRPFVDDLVFTTLGDRPPEDRLLPEDKAILAGIGSGEILIGEEIHNLVQACEKTTLSLVQSMKAKEPNLILLPSFAI